MTARQRRIYWNRERNRQIKYIKIFRTKFFNALQSENRAFLAAYQNSPQDAQRFINDLIIDPTITETLQEIVRRVGVPAARSTFGELRREKVFGSTAEWVQAIMEYLGQNFYDKGIFQIVKTSRELLTKVLERGVTEGWGYYEMSRFMQERVRELTRQRAELIARTEVGRAIHSGQFVGADKSPFVKTKTWIAAKDSRTRGNPVDGQKDKADHWRMDGQTVPFNEKFTDPRSGSQLMHPHDPEAGPADVIQCRCTLAITNLRDENGRLIRKNPLQAFIF